MIEAHREFFIRSLENHGNGLELHTREEQRPAHMLYPHIWDFLHGPNPKLFQDYMKWIHADDQRIDSVCDSMEWFDVGFHRLPLAYVTNEVGEVTTSIQANFYSEEFPSNEDRHGHSRNAKVVWYAPPDTRQIVVQSRLLPNGAKPVEDFYVQEVPILVLGLTPRAPGQAEAYTTREVGRGLAAELVTVSKASLSEEIFNSVGIHHVSHEGPGVAVSIHVKGRRESAALNDKDGLVHYKGLTHEQAALALEAFPAEVGRHRTIVLPRRDIGAGGIEPIRPRPPREVSQRLLKGALHTSEKLFRAA